MTDHVVRLVLAVAAPGLLAPLVGLLLLDGVSGPPRRRHPRVLSLAAGAVSLITLALVDLALLRGGAAWARPAAVVAVLSCRVGGLCLAVLAHPVVGMLRAPSGSPDAVVVLGSTLDPGGRVPAVLVHRLDRALSLWDAAREDGRPVPLVVTGAAAPGSATSEAAAMARYLGDHGVPADCVLLEDRATTTAENLLRVSQLLGARPRAPVAGPEAASVELAVVTSTFHTFRTARAAAALHVPAVVRGAPTPWRLLPAASLRELGVLLRERRPAHVAGWAVLAAAAALAVGLGR